MTPLSLSHPLKVLPLIMLHWNSIVTQGLWGTQTSRRAVILLARLGRGMFKRTSPVSSSLWMEIQPSLVSQFILCNLAFGHSHFGWTASLASPYTPKSPFPIANLKKSRVTFISQEVDMEVDFHVSACVRTQAGISACVPPARLGCCARFSLRLIFLLINHNGCQKLGIYL